MCKRLKYAALSGLLALVLLGFHPAARALAPVQTVESPGGLKAFLIEDYSIPAIALSFSFCQAGAAYDPPERAGLAYLASTTLDEGAGDRDSQTVRQLLEDYSITMRFNTGLDDFRGQIRVLDRYRDIGIELLAEALTSPRFDEEPVARLKSQISASLAQDETDPDERAYQALFATLFPDHGYGQPLEGTIDTLTQIEKSDLQDFVSEHFVRARLSIGVTGAINAQDLSVLLDRLFLALPSGKPCPDLALHEPDFGAPLKQVPLDVPQARINFALPGRGIDHPDYFAARVLNYILGGGSFESRLNREVREQRGLAYSIGTGLYTLEQAAFLFGSVGTSADTREQTLQVIKETMKNLTQEGPTLEEVEAAKSYLTGSYALGFSNSIAIARRLSGLQQYGLGADYPERRPDLIDRVTQEDVARLAKELLDGPKPTIVSVGPS